MPKREQALWFSYLNITQKENVKDEMVSLISAQTGNRVKRQCLFRSEKAFQHGQSGQMTDINMQFF